MPRRLCLSALLALLALAALPALASAAWFPAQPVDGPSPDIERLGGVDLARDGTGGLVYLKRVGGVLHVFLSRFNGGQFRPPEQVDAGIGEGASEAVVAASDQNRLVVVWIAGPRVWGAVVNGGDGPPGPVAGPTALYEVPAGTISNVAVDMGINGAAYATWAAPGGGGSDVRAARLMDTTWSPVGAPLDVDPNQAAGRGTQRPDVTVSAEGNAIVAWGENAADGRARVYARRLTGTNLSAFPQEVSVPDLGGTPGGRADSIDIEVEDDSSFAWALFREDFGGSSRALGRRLLGSTFDPPAFDGGIGAGAPHLGMNGRGQGLGVAENGGSVLGSVLYNDAFQPGQQLSSQPSAQSPDPQPASSEHREVALAWRVSDGAGNGSIRGRLQPDPTSPFDPEVELSRPDLGPVAGGQFAIGADRLAGFAVAMVQGAPGSRTVSYAVHDRPPGRPGAIAHKNAWVSPKRLRWRPGTDLWGQQRFRVVVAGRVLGETTGRSLRSSSRVLRTGKRVSYQVIAIDSRGQQSPSRTRRVRFDGTPPKLSVAVSGRKRHGAAIRVAARARENRGSGVSQIRVRYGDGGGRRARGSRFSGTHVFRHSGSYRLRVIAYDRAGNTRVKAIRLRIA